MMTLEVWTVIDGLGTTHEHVAVGDGGKVYANCGIDHNLPRNVDNDYMDCPVASRWVLLVTR